MHLRITEKKEPIEEFSQKRKGFVGTAGGDVAALSVMVSPVRLEFGTNDESFFGELWSANDWRILSAIAEDRSKKLRSSLGRWRGASAVDGEAYFALATQ